MDNLIKAFNALPQVISEHIQSLVLSKDGSGAFHCETNVDIPDRCRGYQVALSGSESCELMVVGALDIGVVRGNSELMLLRHPLVINISVHVFHYVLLNK